MLNKLWIPLAISLPVVGAAVVVYHYSTTPSSSPSSERTRAVSTAPGGQEFAGNLSPREAGRRTQSPDVAHTDVSLDSVFRGSQEIEWLDWDDSASTLETTATRAAQGGPDSTLADGMDEFPAQDPEPILSQPYYPDSPPTYSSFANAPGQDESPWQNAEDSASSDPSPPDQTASPPPNDNTGSGSGGSPPGNLPPSVTVSLVAEQTTISLGDSTRLTWSSTNATACGLVNATDSPNIVEPVEPNGSRLVSPTHTTTYAFGCLNAQNERVTTIRTIVVQSGGPDDGEIVYTLTVSPNVVAQGQEFTLTWTVTPAREAHPGDWIGMFLEGMPDGAPPLGNQRFYTQGASSGSLTRTMLQSVLIGRYEFRYVSGSSGAVRFRVTLTVVDHPQAPSLNPIGNLEVVVGETLTATLSASDPDHASSQLTLTATNLPAGAVFDSPTLTWTPTDDQLGEHSVTFTVTDPTLASDSETILIRVVAPVSLDPSPTLTLSANPTLISAGQSSTLAWTTTHATDCIASGGWEGAKLPGGSETVSPSAMTSYRLTCSGPGGRVDDMVTVMVQTVIPPDGFDHEAAAYEHLALRMDAYLGGSQVRLIESYRDPYPGSDTTLQRIALVADNAMAVMAFLAPGPHENLQRAKLICDALLWYQAHDPRSDGRLRQAYWADRNLATASQAEIPPLFNTTSTGEIAAAALAWLTYFDHVRDPQVANPLADLNAGYLQAAIRAAEFLLNRMKDPTHPGFYRQIREQVSPEPTLTLSASPTPIPLGGSSTLTWTPTNATSCLASGGWSGEKSSSGGSEPVSPMTTTSYGLTCSGLGGRTSQTVTVAVGTTAGQPIASLRAEPTTIASGERSTLTWSATNVLGCGLANLTDTPDQYEQVNFTGSRDVFPTHTTTYTLGCGYLGGDGQIQQIVTTATIVFLAPLAPPQSQDELVTEKSTEHNLFTSVLMMRLYDLTGESRWQAAAADAKAFVEQVAWNPIEGKFEAGILADQTLDQVHLVANAQSLALLALGNVGTYGRALTWVDQTLRASDTFGGHEFNGYDFGINPDPSDPGYSPSPDGIWFEGTAQMTVAYQVSGASGAEDNSLYYLTQLDAAQLYAQGTNGSGIVAASHDGVTSGFSTQAFYASPHVGSTSWYLTAKRGVNPLWGTRTSDPVPHDVTTEPPNGSPILDYIGNQTVIVSGKLQLAIWASDPNPGDPLHLTVELADGRPLSTIGATFTDNGNGTGTFLWIPSLDQLGEHRLTFTVTDSAGLSDSETITIVVEPANRAPILTLEPATDQTVVVSGKLNVKVSATDADGDRLTFTATGVPSGAYFVPLGDVTLDGLLALDDAQLLRDYLAGGAQLRSEQLAVADVDENGRWESADANLIDQVVAGTQPPLNKYRLVWHPQEAHVGIHTVTFTVADAAGASRTKTSTITVILAEPQAPTDLMGSVLSNTQVRLEWTDNSTNEDGFRIVRWRSDASSAVLDLWIPNHQITSLPNNRRAWIDTNDLTPGMTYAFRVGAYNEGPNNERVFSPPTNTVEVQMPSANNAPILNPIGNQSVLVSGKLNVKISASDPDGDALTFQATGVPSGAYFVPLGDVSLDARLAADDAELIRAHLAGTTQLRSEQVGVSDVDENGKLEAADATLLDALIAGIQPPLNKYRLVWHPQATQVGSHPVTVTVTDPAGASVSESLTITVEKAPPAAPQNLTANPLSSSEVRLIWSDDPTVDGFQITWQRLDVPSNPSTITILIAQTGTFPLYRYWDHTGLTPSATYQYTIKASNGGGLSGPSNTAKATTFAANNPPTLNPIGNQTVVVSGKLNVKISASDPDGDRLTFQATGIPSGAYFVPLGDVTLDGRLAADDVSLLRAYHAGTAQLRSEQLGVADVDQNGKFEPADATLLEALIAGTQPAQNIYRFIWIPQATQVGIHPVTFTVTDAAGSRDAEAVTVTVNPK